MQVKIISGLFVFLLTCLILQQVSAQDTIKPPPDPYLKLKIPDFFLITGENAFIKGADSTLNGFQVVNPVYKNSYSNLYTGNLGCAVMPDFFRKDPLPLKLTYGIHSFDVYDFGISPSLQKNKKIHTTLAYSRGTKKEQYFKLEHKQKFNKNIIAGMELAAGASQGYFGRQLSALRNFDIFGLYNTKDYRYRLYAKFIYNKASCQENGGLKYDSTLVGVSAADARTLPVWLNDAERIQKEKAVYLQQQFFVIRPFTLEKDSVQEMKASRFSLDISHSFLFHDKGIIFQTATVHNDYFPAIYYDSSATFDSSHIRSYFNDVKVNFSVKNLASLDELIHADFFLGTSRQDFKINQRELDTLFDDLTLYGGLRVNLTDICTLDFKYNNSVYAAIEGGNKFEAGLHYQAYNDFLHLRFRYEREKQIPALFSQLNFSNHYLWYNNFDLTGINRFDLEFDLPWLNFNSEICYLQTTGFIYYDWFGFPQQYSPRINSLSARMAHQLNYKRFHLINKVLLQSTDRPWLMPLPRYTTNHSLFYEQGFFKRALLTQVGFDLRYTTSFYSPYYQPATGQFVLQYEKKYGDYLFADVFLNFKVKTARFFFKVEHLNAGWNKKSYMLVAHYPMQGRMLKFGVTWNMFD